MVSEHEVRHTYRIEVKVPRVVPKPGRETTWRTLAPPDKITHTLEVLDHLRESLTETFPASLVAEWFAANVRAVEYTTTVDRTRELAVQVTEDGFVRPVPQS